MFFTFPWPFFFVMVFVAGFFPPVHGMTDDPQNPIRHLEQVYNQTQTWQAEFTQVTFVELLGRSISKEGDIAVKKPGKLRIEYTGSDGKIYISNGQKLWISSPQDNQVQVFPKMKKIVAREALSFLEGLGSLDKEFHVQFLSKNSSMKSEFSDKNLILLELLPRNKDSVIKKIVMGVDPKNSFVKETTLLNESGNKTHYVFKNIELGKNLPDHLFELK